MHPLGPVSSFLEEALRKEVLQQGIVVWLDVHDHYTGFVDGLIAARAAGQLPYAVHAYRGSHLALLLELEEVAGGLERTPLLLHLPGFDEDSVRRTPLLELYAAGRRFRKALDTLITDAAAGRVPPALIDEARHRGLSLSAADAWLAGLLHEQSGGGLGALLMAMRLDVLVDDLLSGGHVAGCIAAAEGVEPLWASLEARAGLAPAWRADALPPGPPRPAEAAFALASWALAVEYVDDLARPPKDPRLKGIEKLPRAVIDDCRALAGHLRDRHATFYQRTADETEGWLVDEVLGADAAVLGKIDTFRFEEDAVLKAALEALDREEWSLVLGWAAARAKGESFWLRDDHARRSAWQLIHGAVQLGLAVKSAGSTLRRKGVQSVDEAVAAYVARGAAVDRAHRHLEQQRAKQLFPYLPEFKLLRERLDHLREVWRAWADQWAIDFNDLCHEHGFLPSPGLQQRGLFDEVVRPLTQEGGVTAVFVVDALRYEMGEELYLALEGSAATTAHLRPRLAELPTVTNVGMNVLAPVARDGRLRPTVRDGAFLGFSTGQLRVDDPATRRRAMADRVGGAVCPLLSLGGVLEAGDLRAQLAGARLVVVHSLEVDSAGENGFGPTVFDTIMQQLRAAHRLLREAGVRRFVFTADHGFLLLSDPSLGRITHGTKAEASRRHVVSAAPEAHKAKVSVPLAALGYDVEGEGAGGPPLHLVFPASTAVFHTHQGTSGFVHGGNSLQERVIPVLTVVHRAAAGADTARYVVTASAGPGTADMHQLRAQVGVELGQRTLSFGGSQTVELRLRAPEAPEVVVDHVVALGGAAVERGAVVAKVGEEFDLFFKLIGPDEVKVRVELGSATASEALRPMVLAERFAVSPTPRAKPTPVGVASSAEPPPTARPPRPADDWIGALEPSVREVFSHLAAHGVVTEEELGKMLGGARAARRFANELERHARQAPFDVRIDFVGGVKRFVREGSTP
jgi:hypothetical protein